MVALCITFVSAFLIAFVPASHAFPPLGALNRFALALVGCAGPLALAAAAACPEAPSPEPECDTAAQIIMHPGDPRHQMQGINARLRPTTTLVHTTNKTHPSPKNNKCTQVGAGDPDHHAAGGAGAHGRVGGVPAPVLAAARQCVRHGVRARPPPPARFFGAAAVRGPSAALLRYAAPSLRVAFAARGCRLQQRQRRRKCSLLLGSPSPHIAALPTATPQTPMRNE